MSGIQMALLGSGGITRFLGSGFSSGAFAQTYGSAVDSAGNMYMLTLSGVSSSSAWTYDRFIITKITPNGTVAAQYQYVDNNTGYNLNSGQGGGCTIGIDSSNNLYVSVAYYYGSSPMGVMYWKINSSNFSITWQKYVTDATTSTNIYSTDMYIDSATGYGYVVGEYYNGSKPPGTSCFLMKFSLSDGSFTYGKLQNPYPNDDYYGAVTVDSAGAVIVAGVADQLIQGSFGNMITKFTAAGALTWTYVYDASGTYPTGLNGPATSVITDSSNNIYFTSFLDERDQSGTYYSYLTKLNSSGVVQWTRRLGTIAAHYAYPAQALAYDGTYIYLQGGEYGAFFKFDTDGTLQWQRDLGLLWGNGAGRRSVIYNNNKLYLATNILNGLGGYAPLTATTTFGVISASGTTLGTYGGYTYSAGAYTVTSPSIFTKSSTLSSTITSFTVNSSTPAFTASATTPSLTIVGMTQ
jgi:hypothetical protein